MAILLLEVFPDIGKNGHYNITVPISALYLHLVEVIFGGALNRRKIQIQLYEAHFCSRHLYTILMFKLTRQPQN